jgi:uncharacterized protein with PQ loop repeat
MSAEITLIRVVSAILLTVGVVFYLSWGILYNAFLDIGLYSFTAPLVIFGILGLLLARAREKEEGAQ